MGRRQKLLQFSYDRLAALPRPLADRPPRFRIVTAYDDAIAAYGDIAAADKAAYAARHGYELRVHRSGFDASRPPAWSKIRFVLRELRGADWVVWMDADTLIADHARPLADFVSPDADLVIARHAKPGLHANTGVFFLRNRLWSRLLLRHVYAQTHVIHHGWWEQMGLLLILDGYRFSRVRYENARAFNSLYRSEAPDDVYRPGDFLVHFAGIGDRPRLMGDFAAARAAAP